ncbi:DUF1287 domain-containing protein [Desulfotomaculum copahuensis]|uniref:DUF1287 domain-containing protein n=1 Tax=Desulfotomaculum copahuensis TaxID=1838280 RepID=UPI001372E419|nr:DUF1287 domain-containing protein [Desulfotomaculum copahuensis]
MVGYLDAGEGVGIRYIKWPLLFIVFLFAGGLYIFIFHTYNPGKMQAITNDQSLSRQERFVSAAESLRGVLYDYARGHLVKYGLLVCTDVPRLCYPAAGINLERLMAADYRLHPEHYPGLPGNDPGSPYFSRRVQNIYAFFKDTNRLVGNCSTPKPGDTVFYGQAHVTMVVKVYPDHTYDEIEAAPGIVFTAIHRHKPWAPRDVGRFKRLAL